MYTKSISGKQICSLLLIIYNIKRLTGTHTLHILYLQTNAIKNNNLKPHQN